jgi:hypothetical protein
MRIFAAKDRSVRHYAGAVYGTILVMALLAIEPDTEPAEEVAAAVAVTMIVFWLAHVYAHSIATRLRTGEELSWQHIRAQASSEWPIVQASAPAVIALLLAAVGVFDTGTAIAIGLGLGMLQLFGWGVFIGRLQGLPPARAVLVGVIDCSFGLAIVGLETLVH